MNLTNFRNTLEAGINNPECAFFVGNMTGKSMVYIDVAVVLFAIFFFRAADKLIISPLLDWVKNKIYGGKL